MTFYDKLKIIGYKLVYWWDMRKYEYLPEVDILLDKLMRFGEFEKNIWFGLGGVIKWEWRYFYFTDDDPLHRCLVTDSVDMSDENSTYDYVYTNAKPSRDMYVRMWMWRDEQFKRPRKFCQTPKINPKFEQLFK